jgi:C1A family cysteine protease
LSLIQEEEMPISLRPKSIQLPGGLAKMGTGWLPPIYDRRDYNVGHAEIQKLSKRLGDQLKKNRGDKLDGKLPIRVDLRPWCSPVEHQLELNSCTAHAAMAAVEYYERKTFGKHIDGSRLFVYKMTRNLQGLNGNVGAWIKNAMGAIVTCGVPPEQYWPYTDADPDFDADPPAFVHAMAGNYKSTKYFCHDPLGLREPKPKVLASVKRYLAAGVPVMFGYFGYQSCNSGEQPGDTPMPTPAEVAGRPSYGHAVTAMGYDDNRIIVNKTNNHKTKGALLYRNHAGETWGEAGYGWMPYEYVLSEEALDFWSMLSMDWLDVDQFFQN